MSISNISTQNTYAVALQQKQQNWNNLFSALKAGDLASAQKAYSASGLPPMAKGNTTALGKLYQALNSGDLAGAQKAALDLQPKNAGKEFSTSVTPSVNSAQIKKTTIQAKAEALVNASKAAQQSSLLDFMGLGSNVNTTA